MSPWKLLQSSRQQPSLRDLESASKNYHNVETKIFKIMMLNEVTNWRHLLGILWSCKSGLLSSILIPAERTWKYSNVKSNIYIYIQFTLCSPDSWPKNSHKRQNMFIFIVNLLLLPPLLAINRCLQKVQKSCFIKATSKLPYEIQIPTWAYLHPHR